MARMSIGRARRLGTTGGAHTARSTGCRARGAEAATLSSSLLLLHLPLALNGARTREVKTEFSSGVPVHQLSAVLVTPFRRRRTIGRKRR